MVVARARGYFEQRNYEIHFGIWWMMMTNIQGRKLICVVFTHTAWWWYKKKSTYYMCVQCLARKIWAIFVFDVFWQRQICDASTSYKRKKLLEKMWRQIFVSHFFVYYIFLIGKVPCSSASEIICQKWLVKSLISQFSIPTNFVIICRFTTNDYFHTFHFTVGFLMGSVSWRRYCCVRFGIAYNQAPFFQPKLTYSRIGNFRSQPAKISTCDIYRSKINRNWKKRFALNVQQRLTLARWWQCGKGSNFVCASARFSNFKLF